VYKLAGVIVEESFNVKLRCAAIGVACDSLCDLQSPPFSRKILNIKLGGCSCRFPRGIPYEERGWLRLGRAALGACIPKSFLGGAIFYGMIDSEKLSLGFRLAVATPALIEDFVRNRE